MVNLGSTLRRSQKGGGEGGQSTDTSTHQADCDEPDHNSPVLSGSSATSVHVRADCTSCNSLTVSAGNKERGRKEDKETRRKGDSRRQKETEAEERERGRDRSRERSIEGERERGRHRESRERGKRGRGERGREGDREREEGGRERAKVRREGGRGREGEGVRSRERRKGSVKWNSVL